MFLSNYLLPPPVHDPSKTLKLAIKVGDEYSAVEHLAPQPVPKKKIKKPQALLPPVPVVSGNPTVPEAPPEPGEDEQTTVVAGAEAESKDEKDEKDEGAEGTEIGQLVEQLPTLKPKEPEPLFGSALVPFKDGGIQDENRTAGEQTEASISHRLITWERSKKVLKPEWHPPWKLMRLIPGHLGWVRTVAVDASNEWFASGSADRTIKIWDLASGVLRLTLTGHINTVNGICISDRHPYLFSCGQDKLVRCWDLEQNKTVRSYHGHLSGVYCIALHPTLDVLVTGGRDSCARVWDMRTKAQVRVLGGHKNTVGAVTCQASDPQVMTGSHDSTIRLWDLATGECTSVLTNHKKSVRALLPHHTEYTFASGSADNIKVWKCPEGKFMRNISGHNAIVNALAINRDNVLVSGGDNGSLLFWDWKTGYNFQQIDTTPQPGSLESEAGIFSLVFDRSGSRLITAEADKSIKVYKEDETATPQTHPIKYRPYKRKHY